VEGTFAGALAAQTPEGDYDGDCRTRGMAAELSGMSGAGFDIAVTVEQRLVDKVVTRTRLISHSADIQPPVRPRRTAAAETPEVAPDSQPTVP
jgi:hypothetical protein